MTDDVSSRLRLVTAAASEPVSLSEAKLFLRIEHATEDTVILRAITAAREACEAYLGCALLPQRWSYAVAGGGKRCIALPFGPATSIEAVTVTSNGVTTELNEAAHRLSVDGFSLYLDVAAQGVMTVEYDASLADSENGLPALLKQGVLHHVAAAMHLREGAAPMPLQSLHCYQPYRRVRL